MPKEMIDCAKGALKAVRKFAIDSSDVDDYDLAYAAYFLEQAAEQSLKAILEHFGVNGREIGHRIISAYHSVCHYGANILSKETCDYLETYGNFLTSCESKCRYPSDFATDFKEVEFHYKAVRQLYDEARRFCDAHKVKKSPGVVETLKLFGVFL